MSKKGQIFSLDVLFALGIFLFLFLSSLTLWHLSQERAEDTYERAQMEMKARLALMSLLKTSGSPGDWYLNESFTSLGLITGGDYLLNSAKVQAFQQLNFSYANTSASLGIVGYQSYFYIANSTGNLYTFGLRPSSYSVNVVHLERLAFLDDAPVTVVLEVWN